MKHLQEFVEYESLMEKKKKMHIPIPKDIENIKDIFIENGFKLYVVGGAVRDALLGKDPKDYDLATDALPDQILDMMEGKYKVLKTGEKFGIINVITPSDEYEIATFRKDIGKGRRPDSVEFTTIENDVKRRDLTINALFYDIDTEEVVDLVGGMEDLKKGIVRTVGRAEDRFDEDELRILRAIRFAGRFGSNLDPEVDKALQKSASLKGISSERIRDEFIKGIKTSKSTVHFLGLIDKYNLFDWIFPELEVNKEFIEESDPEILITELLKGNDVDLMRKKLNKLTYSIEEIGKISYLINFLKLSPETSYILKKKQKDSKLTNEEIKKFADLNNLDPKLVNAFLRFKLSVRGEEIMNQGFKKDEIGREILRREIANFQKLL